MATPLNVYLHNEPKNSVIVFGKKSIVITRRGAGRLLATEITASTVQSMRKWGGEYVFLAAEQVWSCLFDGSDIVNKIETEFLKM